MKLRNKGAEFFVPDNKSLGNAIDRTTHMAIAAHQDDIEIMAYDGILKCFGKDDQWFFAVVVTNGAVSARDGRYSVFTDENMQNVRKLEQKKAAFIGEYGAVALLDYPSSAAKDPKNQGIVSEIRELISFARPKIIYTHNLADKHDTHVGVVNKVIHAIRELPENERPEKLFGCEVWRSLDWVNDEDKVVFDVSAHPNITASIIEVFDSQISGGKRYDLATAGRRIANATYLDSYSVDTANSVIYGMDLTPLIVDKELDIIDYIAAYIKRFEQDVSNRISRLLYE